MEMTLKELTSFTPLDSNDEKREKLKALHFSRSGHIVATNSYVLYATKENFDIEKAGLSFKASELLKDNFVKSDLEFPEYRQVIPNKSTKKVTIYIPKWFELFKDHEQQVGLVLDYANLEEPFFKTSKKVGEDTLSMDARFLSCLAGMRVDIIINDSLSPTLITKENSSIDIFSDHLKEDIENLDWYYLIMPIKLDQSPKREVYY